MTLPETTAAILGGLALLTFSVPATAQQQNQSNADRTGQPSVQNGVGEVVFPACEGLEGAELTDCLNNLMLQAAREGVAVARTIEE